MTHELTRRRFIEHAAAIGGAVGLGRLWAGEPAASEPQPLKPIGEARGVHPGRVVWVHDPEVTDWEGPGDGHWYQDNHTKQNRADQMVARAVCDLAGDGTPRNAWDKLFRHFNRVRGKGDVGYRPGEKVVIKPNWVGMIWREGAVDPETYKLVKRHDYMNTAPQMIVALLRQLVGVAGVAEADISVCDTLAYLVNEYYEILHGEYPKVQYEDYAGRFGRIQVQQSTAPFYWSCRPQGVTPDFVPQCFAEAEYLINFANLKAHTGAGVTLCAKNHFGSLVRWPVQKGYYDMHLASFSRATQVYRELVDLMGHAQLGGKTVLCLMDGLYPGKHPIDPRRAGGHHRRSTANGPPVCWLPKTPSPSIPSGSTSSGPSGTTTRIARARTTTCTRPRWRTIRPPVPSTTPITPRPTSDSPASASTSTGTTPRKRSTRRNLEAGEGIELVAAGPA